MTAPLSRDIIEGFFKKSIFVYLKQVKKILFPLEYNHITGVN